MPPRNHDGAHGGMIVNRIAHVRGAWRSCAIPIYEARRPDDPEIGDSLVRTFQRNGFKPVSRGSCDSSTAEPKTPVSTGRIWKRRVMLARWMRSSGKPTIDE